MATSGPFDEGVVQQYGGVAWAKAQGQILEMVPSAIDGQIAGYQAAADQLQQVQDVVNNGNNQLKAAWSGAAATAANAAFSQTANQAQGTIDMINNTIAQLQNAKAAASQAAAALARVPDEQPVPHPDLWHQFLNTTGISSDHVAQIQQQNTAARTQAANVLNTFSAHYTDIANNMTSLASNAGQDSFTPSGSSSTAFQFAASPPSGSSSGAAGSYQPHWGSPPVRSGAAVSPVSTGSSSGSSGGVTQLAGGPPSVGMPATPAAPAPVPLPTNPHGPTGPTSPLGPTSPVSPVVPVSVLPPATPVPSPPNSVPSPPDPVPAAGSPSSPSAGAPTPIAADAATPVTDTTAPPGSGVFGENGFTPTSTPSATGGETAVTAPTTPPSPGAPGDAVPPNEAGQGITPSQSSASGSQGLTAMGGGSGAAGGSAEERYNARYSRGPFLADGENDVVTNPDWKPPAVGGDETLLMPEQRTYGGADGPVISVYNRATNALGQPLFAPGRTGHPHEDDADNERGHRPTYLKEDPTWWHPDPPHN